MRNSDSYAASTTANTYRPLHVGAVAGISGYRAGDNAPAYRKEQAPEEEEYDEQDDSKHDDAGHAIDDAQHRGYATAPSVYPRFSDQAHMDLIQSTRELSPPSDDSDMETQTTMLDRCQTVIRDLDVALDKETGWAWSNLGLAVELHDTSVRLEHFKSSIHQLTMDYFEQETDDATIDNDSDARLLEMLDMLDKEHTYLAGVVKSYLDDIHDIVRAMRTLDVKHMKNPE